MSIEQILDKDAIVINIQGKETREVIQEGAKYFNRVYSLKVSSDVIAKELLKREELGSTGVGNGVAFPHARISGLEKVVGLLAISEKGVNFNAEDGKPVKILFFLIGPDKRPADLLQALATVSKLFRQKKVRQKTLEMKAPEDIYKFLVEEELRLEKEQG